MSEIDNEAARKGIESLQEENSHLKGDRLELTDELLSYTGLPGHMYGIDVKMKQLNALLVRAADALEKSQSETDF
jgi:hypothetical protein